MIAYVLAHGESAGAAFLTSRSFFAHRNSLTSLGSDVAYNRAKTKQETGRGTHLIVEDSRVNPTICPFWTTSAHSHCGPSCPVNTTRRIALLTAGFGLVGLGVAQGDYGGGGGVLMVGPGVQED